MRANDAARDSTIRRVLTLFTLYNSRDFQSNRKFLSISEIVDSIYISVTRVIQILRPTGLV